jgi:hypothetical protein
MVTARGRRASPFPLRTGQGAGLAGARQVHWPGDALRRVRPASHGAELRATGIVVRCGPWPRTGKRSLCFRAAQSEFRGTWRRQARRYGPTGSGSKRSARCTPGACRRGGPASIRPPRRARGRARGQTPLASLSRGLDGRAATAAAFSDARRSRLLRQAASDALEQTQLRPLPRANAVISTPATKPSANAQAVARYGSASTRS